MDAGIHRRSWDPFLVAARATLPWMEHREKLHEILHSILKRNLKISVCVCVCRGARVGGGKESGEGEDTCPYLQTEQLQWGNGETCSDYATNNRHISPPFSSAFPDTKPVPFRYSPLSFINYTCTDASPSCDTDLALDVVFIFKDGSTFAKVHARAKRDASSPSKAALSVN